MRGKRDIGWSIILLLTLIFLSGCTLERIAAQQPKTTGLWDELIGGQNFGQSFVSRHDNLYRIDLGTATFARINTAPVSVYLKENPQAHTVLFSFTLPAADIQNERPTSFVFPAISHSRGKTFYIYIESPQAAPGNAIGVYANQHDQYPDGSAYRNGQPVSGDLVFTAYSRQVFTFSGILGDFSTQVSQDVPFFLFYGFLLLVVCAGLFLSIRKRW